MQLRTGVEVLEMTYDDLDFIVHNDYLAGLCSKPVVVEKPYTGWPIRVEAENSTISQKGSLWYI